MKPSLGRKQTGDGPAPPLGLPKKGKMSLTFDHLKYSNSHNYTLLSYLVVLVVVAEGDSHQVVSSAGAMVDPHHRSLTQLEALVAER